MNRSDDAPKDYNPRYVVYAATHGRTPQEQLTADRQKYPGCLMAGFLIWLPEQWRRWAVESGEMKRGGWDSRQHAAFDAWLRATITTKGEV